MEVSEYLKNLNVEKFQLFIKAEGFVKYSIVIDSFRSCWCNKSAVKILLVITSHEKEDNMILVQWFTKKGLVENGHKISVIE